MLKNPRLGKNSISFHFSHIGFVEKTDCKLSVSNGSANFLRTYKMKNIFLLVGIGRWDKRTSPSWILHFFYCIFSKKRSFHLFSEEKIKFHHF